MIYFLFMFIFRKIIIFPGVAIIPQESPKHSQFVLTFKRNTSKSILFYKMALSLKWKDK